ncbi:MAG TPA: endonuclease/exonuclease/phosphatase family protein [Sandaracinaceae bacterium LLY-WYZ-13_1]|nr:endonuclease/exonuclease/phosphatase family protein [Sandaracinaceae bacterium LLY-WYZ-13_1]
MGEGPGELRVATYNVHGCVGMDGRLDPERVARVIRQTEASVVGLQEVDCLRPLGDGRDQLEQLADAARMTPVPGPTRRRGDGYFGNALLSSHPVVEVERSDLSVPGYEPRGVLVVELAVGGRPLRVAVTHFGLRAKERARQVEALLEVLSQRVDGPTVLMGDFNEWRPRAVTLVEMHALFGYGPPVRSFPSRLPVFALDRVWVHPSDRLRGVDAHRSPSSRLASDHLPVVARIVLVD